MAKFFFCLLHLPVLHFPRSSRAPRHLISETETNPTALRYWSLAEQLNMKLQSNPSEVSGVIVHSKYRDQYIGRRLLLTTKTRNTTFSIVQTISVRHFIKGPNSWLSSAILEADVIFFYMSKKESEAKV